MQVGHLLLFHIHVCTLQEKNSICAWMDGYKNCMYWLHSAIYSARKIFNLVLNILNLNLLTFNVQIEVLLTIDKNNCNDSAYHELTRITFFVGRG